ncbi:MAG: hypothetical protein ACI93T_001098, partial [Porticoccaceae bacterium]
QLMKWRLPKITSKVPTLHDAVWKTWRGHCSIPTSFFSEDSVGWVPPTRIAH